jgi:hypothetical protein
MPQRQYRKIDLNELSPRRDEIDVLNDAGGEGWELVVITPNHMAYLMRAIEEPEPAPKPSRTRSRRSASA